MGYLPTRDAELGQWASNFSMLISASPNVYGLLAGDAAAIASYVIAFNAALAVVNNPATKTMASVASKDAAKAAMLEIVRGYALQVRNNKGVSNADKTTLGLTIVDPTRTPIPPPISSPLVKIVAATPGQHTLRYADANTPDSRRKAAGATGLQLFVAVSSEVVSDPQAARFKSLVTRQPYGVNFSAAENGKLATYFARWQNRKGEVGPWSAGTAFTIVA